MFKKHNSVGKRISRDAAFISVAEELSQFWIFGLNIYPFCKSAIVDRIRLAYEGRKKGKHCKAIPGFVT